MGRSERSKRLRVLALAQEARERRHAAVERGTPVAAAWLRDHPQFPGAPSRPSPSMAGEYIPWAPRTLQDVQDVLFRMDIAAEQSRQLLLATLATRRRQWARLHGNPVSDVPWT